MSVKAPFRLIGRIFRNLYFLTFLNGFLIASLFYLKMEANYETQLFRVIQHSINKSIDTNDTQDSIVVKAMHACNNLLTLRSSVFENDESLDGFKVDYFRPATVDLMTASGACGSYSLVLARVLQEYNFPVRIAQMKANGIFAAHNIVEVKLNDRWAVLDPTFDLYFVTPAKRLATFNDIKNDWQYYSKQVPANYNLEYRYEDVRYTNWGKVPLISPASKLLLSLFLGKEKANEFCLRIHFLRLYDIVFYCFLALYVPIFLMTFTNMIKRKLFPTYDTPVTFHNIAKYIKLRFSSSPLNRSIDS
jgi:hypothetical protein